VSKNRHSVKRRPVMTGGKMTEELRPRNERKPRGKWKLLDEARKERADEYWKTGKVTTPPPILSRKVKHLTLIESKPESEPEPVVLDGIGPDSFKRGLDFRKVERAMVKGLCVRCEKPKRKNRKKHPLCAQCLRELRNRRQPLEKQ
jgi:hypothetical protein